MSNKKAGDEGEQFVVDKIKCPNCDKKLMLLPPNYPMYDIQCTACNFRVQVKTNNCKPKSVIFGAGYQIYEKVMKAGYLSPPLIVIFNWTEKNKDHKEVRFYPFIGKGNIKKYKLSEKAKRANYMMFRYEKLDILPFMLLHKE